MDSNFRDFEPSQHKPAVMPDNNLIWAILSTIFCCLPFGIYAIICSTKVNSLWVQGDFKGAQKAADDARRWSIYGAVAYLILVGIIIIFYILVIVFGMFYFNEIRNLG